MQEQYSSHIYFSGDCQFGDTSRPWLTRSLYSWQSSSKSLKVFLSYGSFFTREISPPLYQSICKLLLLSPHLQSWLILPRSHSAPMAPLNIVHEGVPLNLISHTQLIHCNKTSPRTLLPNLHFTVSTGKVREKEGSQTFIREKTDVRWHGRKITTARGMYEDFNTLEYHSNIMPVNSLSWFMKPGYASKRGNCVL